MKFPVRIPPPRRAERTLLPAALTALLGLMLAVQLALPSTVEFPEASIARPLRLQPLGVPPVAPDPEISLRPMFAPGRRESASAEVASRQAPLEGARAVGIITARGNARVFLQAPDGTITRIGPGGSYRGWRLVRIAPGKLMFVRGAEIAALTLAASTPPVAAAAAATEVSEEEETQ